RLELERAEALAAAGDGAQAVDALLPLIEGPLGRHAEWALRRALWAAGDAERLGELLAQRAGATGGAGAARLHVEAARVAQELAGDGARAAQSFAAAAA